MCFITSTNFKTWVNCVSNCTIATTGIEMWISFSIFSNAKVYKSIKTCPARCNRCDSSIWLWQNKHSAAYLHKSVLTIPVAHAVATYTLSNSMPHTCGEIIGWSRDFTGLFSSSCKFDGSRNRHRIIVADQRLASWRFSLCETRALCTLWARTFAATGGRKSYPWRCTRT